MCVCFNLTTLPPIDLLLPSHSPEETALKNHIDAVLKKHNIEMRPDMVGDSQ